MAKDDAEILTVDGREVRISNPQKLYFSKEAKLTKLELVRAGSTSTFGFFRAGPSRK